jgi:phage host-nuclease inhibitor protein Gam
MREQMNALSKQVGNNAQEIARLSVQHSVNSQEATENYRAIEALKEDLGELRKNTSAWMDSEHAYSARTRMMLETESAKWRNAIGSLAANVHDKLEALGRGE